MPKLKTHRGAAKRFKVTGSGKVKRRRAKLRHILTSKTKKVKRHLRKRVMVSESNLAPVLTMLRKT